MLPALTREHAVTCCITPLIALAKDQAESCADKGIYAEIWNSDICDDKKARIERELKDPELSLKILFTTPESLQQQRLTDCLKSAHQAGTLISFAVDEAHCVSTWGHDFRSSYLSLGSYFNSFQGVPITALTATATANVQSAITRELGLGNPVVMRSSFNRPNIRYSVKAKEKLGFSEAQVLKVSKIPI